MLKGKISHYFHSLQPPPPAKKQKVGPIENVDAGDRNAVMTSEQDPVVEKENQPTIVTSVEQEHKDETTAGDEVEGSFEKGAATGSTEEGEQAGSSSEARSQNEQEDNDDATTEPLEEEEELNEPSPKPVVEKEPPAAWDLWDSRHLRLPCSSHCRNKWDTISNKLANPIPDLDTLLELIVAVSSTQLSKKNLAGLAKTVEAFSADEKRCLFGDVLPGMARAVLALPERLCSHGEPIPLLLAGEESVVRVPRALAFSLLAAGFFCCIPLQGHRDARLPTCNFQGGGRGLFARDYDPRGDSQAAKLRCFLHYFERCSTAPPEGELAVRRCVLDTSDLDWDADATPLAVVDIKHEESIEECAGTVQVDFANRVLGGGVLGRGAVQEEIRFSVCPELLMSRLLCSAMERHEAVIIYGSEQYARYEGYASSFKFAGAHQDTTLRGPDGSPRTAVLAIDATNFNRNPGEQYTEDALDRELNKAYCGFDSPASVPGSEATQSSGGELGLKEMAGCRARVCTGNWGCGVFGGEVEAKFVIQLLAASRAQRPMLYIAYQDADLAARLVRLNGVLRQQAGTVGELYSLALRYCSSRYSSLDFDDMLGFMEAGGEKKEPQSGEGEEEGDEEDTPSIALSCEASETEEEEGKGEALQPIDAAAPILHVAGVKPPSMAGDGVGVNVGSMPAGVILDPGAALG